MKISFQTPRSIAIEILCQWQKTGKSIDLIKKRFSGSLSESRDKQLATALVFGVLRQQGHLDWVITKFSSHPLAKMKPLTLQALRVGLYQLLYMDRIPASAAINETVQVIKQNRQPKWLSGFVNGLLRNVSRNIESCSMTADTPLYAQLSHPQWLIERWQKRWGSKKTIEICLLNNSPAQLCLCVNSIKTDRQKLAESFAQAEIKTEPGLLSPDALILPDYRGPVASLPGFKEGFFQVQDEIAQLVVYLLSPFSNGIYLDGCAGLGGKTSLLAQVLSNSSESPITAVEPQESRNALFAENLSRLDLIHKVQSFAGDIESFARQTTDRFVGVLIDAPCSGTGVIRRHPDIRWNRSPADFQQFQKKQINIMKTAATLTAPDGILVYATCSMEPEENEDLLDIFLEKHPGFKLENAGGYLPKQAKHLITERGFLQSTPSQTCSDGFFAARLRRDI